jgi:flagellar hook-length control protein FliK
VATPSPVAIVLTVIVPTTDVPAAPPASGTATAPLAIAAAAIAANSPAPAAPTASQVQIKIDSDAADAAADAVANAAANAATVSAAVNVTTSSDAASAGKIAVQAAASDAVIKPVKQRLVQTDATAITDATLVVAATAPVVPKTTLAKATVATPTKTAAAGDADSASRKPDPAAPPKPTELAHTGFAQQPAAAARQDTRTGVVEAAKADASAGAASPPDVDAAHDHSAISAAAHAPADSTEIGTQPTGAFQVQLPPVTAVAPPVGPLSIAVATNVPVPLSGLALEIAASASAGKSRFEIRLDPADLGRIDVRIDVDRNGQVTSHLTVERPETLSMLRQDAPQLQRALDDAGFKTGSDGLQFSLRDQSSSGQNNGNETGRNAQRLVISEDDAIPAVVAGRTYGRMLGSSSGVDIRV